MIVKIKVHYPGNDDLDYELVCSAEEAAQREPWAAAFLNAPEFKRVEVKADLEIAVEMVYEKAGA